MGLALERSGLLQGFRSDSGSQAGPCRSGSQGAFRKAPDDQHRPNGSGPGALEEQLHLTHRRPADVEDGPTGGQNNRRGHKRNPEIHGGAMESLMILMNGINGRIRLGRLVTRAPRALPPVGGTAGHAAAAPPSLPRSVAASPAPVHPSPRPPPAHPASPQSPPPPTPQPPP